MDNKIYFVSQAGYDLFLEELDNLKSSLNRNGKEKSESFASAIGDGWHDNFAFEQSMIEDQNIATKINCLLAKKKFIKIIPIENSKKEFVNIGDILALEIKYEKDDIENLKVKLTGNYFSKTNVENGIQEITLNSPLGKALYKKNINDKNINYFVQNKKVEIKVIEKIDFRK